MPINPLDATTEDEDYDDAIQVEIIQTLFLPVAALLAAIAGLAWLAISRILL